MARPHNRHTNQYTDQPALPQVTNKFTDQPANRPNHQPTNSNVCHKITHFIREISTLFSGEFNTNCPSNGAFSDQDIKGTGIFISG
jgi:hypothetical protein